MSLIPSGARSAWFKPSWKALAVPLLLFFLIPLVALFLRVSPQSLWANLGSAPVLQAVGLSLLTSTSTVVLTVIFGTPVAYYLSHRHYRFFRWVDTLVELPTVLPPSVAGLALLMAFGRFGLVGVWLAPLGITIPFSTAAVVMAQLFIAAPLYIKSAALGFAGVDCELRKAASLDGASRWDVFRFIMLPMAWMPVLTGCVMTWARALGEFGATILFAGNFPGRTQTMPLAIYIGFEIDLDMALTLSVILVGLSFLVLILVKGFFHAQSRPRPEEIWD